MTQPERFRYRIKFAKTQAMRFTSHLDLQRAWERNFRRANMPLTYSQGFNPRPKINLASALPLGFTSRCEMIDVWFDGALSINEVLEKLRLSAPPGIEILEVEEVDLRESALQQSLVSAEYLAVIEDDLSIDDLRTDVEALLAREGIIRRRRGKEYDLRPLIEAIAVSADENGHPRVEMKLAAREGSTGRPDEVLEALGLDPLGARIERIGLNMA